MNADYTLAQKAVKGDQDAFTALYNQTHSRIFKSVFSWTKDSDKAQDLVQDIYVHAFRKLHLFRGTAKFYTWLYRIAFNVYLMSKRVKVLPTVSIDDDTDENVSALKTFLGEEDIQQRSVIAKLTLSYALNNLAPGYRKAVIMHHIEGYSFEEVSEITGRSLGNNKSQNHRAKVRMYDILTERTNMSTQVHSQMAATSDICIPCKEAGFPNVSAHYKGVPKGMSHDGKEHPPMCYAHKNGKVPAFFPASLQKEKEQSKIQVRSDNNDYTQLTLEQGNKICEMRKEGYALPVIAEALNVKIWRVQKYCTENNVEVGKPMNEDLIDFDTPEFKAKVMDYRKQNYSWQTISTLTNIAIHRLYNRYRHEDINWRNGMGKLTSSTHQEIVAQPASSDEITIKISVKVLDNFITNCIHNLPKEDKIELAKKFMSMSPANV